MVQMDVPSGGSRYGLHICQNPGKALNEEQGCWAWAGPRKLGGPQVLSLNGLSGLPRGRTASLASGSWKMPHLLRGQEAIAPWPPTSADDRNHLSSLGFVLNTDAQAHPRSTKSEYLGMKPRPQKNSPGGAYVQLILKITPLGVYPGGEAIGRTRQRTTRHQPRSPKRESDKIGWMKVGKETRWRDRERKHRSGEKSTSTRRNCYLIWNSPQMQNQY